MSLRICFFVRNISMPSGTERVTSVIANCLAAHGYQISIMSLWGGLEPFYEKHPNVALFQLFANQAHGNKGVIPAIIKQLLRFPHASIRLRQFLKKHPQDILVDTDYLLGQVALPAVAGLKIKHVHWEHFNFKLDTSRPLKKLGRLIIASRTQGLVTLTERDRDYWQKGANVKGKITTIPNPLPFELPGVCYDEKSRIVLAVGRLNKQKGFDLLLDAWANISHKAAPLGWKLRIVGDGEERANLEALSEHLNIKNSVELVPATPDIGAHYRDAAIFALSSRFEGFGMVLLEAQAYRLPAVAFDCEVGPAEIISNGQSGYLIGDGDVSAFSDALWGLIDSRETRLRFSEQAQSVAQKFLPEPITARWMDYFRILNNE